MHQTELKIVNTNKNKRFGEQIKMYRLCLPAPIISEQAGKNHFYKDDWQELDISTGSIQRKLVEAA